MSCRSKRLSANVTLGGARLSRHWCQTEDREACAARCQEKFRTRVPYSRLWVPVLRMKWGSTGICKDGKITKERELHWALLCRKLVWGSHPPRSSGSFLKKLNRIHVHVSGLSDYKRRNRSINVSSIIVSDPSHHFPLLHRLTWYVMVTVGGIWWKLCKMMCGHWTLAQGSGFSCLIGSERCLCNLLCEKVIWLIKNSTNSFCRKQRHKNLEQCFPETLMRYYPMLL